ncbi:MULTISPECIES: DUF6985 domain-containing protein [Paenibacillus]|uniref:DUF6985 domain-containing protein n=1 Tax=Paenibacillus TaxID=44249 RepID=UPI0010599A20|nr:hypothetical protein [Paenibacillus amylolyticus]TDL70337.1 hypothetical protein E2R58_14695 [Paenibacillus amylolyticus]UOK62297.1 hypothetical protein MT997_29020 [Paenibacillus sp. OVF10]
MANLNHELFGEISYDLYWSGQQKMKMFGKDKAIILSVDGNEEGEFHDAQKEAYTNLIGNMDDIMTKVEEAIFDYYQEVYMDYREMLGEEEADKIASIIENKEELDHLIEPTQLIIRRVRKNGVRRIGLLFNCTWEIEHGLAVKIEDEEIVEVGFQDIVL